jgi:hypothetical protein
MNCHKFLLRSGLIAGGMLSLSLSGCASVGRRRIQWTRNSGAGLVSAVTCEGNDITRWVSKPGDLAGAWLAVDCGTPARFDSIAVREFGPRIQSYRLEVTEGTGWRESFTGQVGASDQWQHSFPAVEASHFRFVALNTNGVNLEYSPPSSGSKYLTPPLIANPNTVDLRRTASARQGRLRHALRTPGAGPRTRICIRHDYSSSA